MPRTRGSSSRRESSSQSVSSICGAVCTRMTRVDARWRSSVGRDVARAGSRADTPRCRRSGRLSKPHAGLPEVQVGVDAHRRSARCRMRRAQRSARAAARNDRLRARDRSTAHRESAARPRRGWRRAPPTVRGPISTVVDGRDAPARTAARRPRAGRHGARRSAAMRAVRATISRGRGLVAERRRRLRPARRARRS